MTTEQVKAFDLEWGAPPSGSTAEDDRLRRAEANAEALRMWNQQMAGVRVE